MAAQTLLLTAASTAVVATAYLLVGLRLGQGRRASDAGDRALRFFALWWIATAANQFAGAALYLAAAFGVTNLEWQLTYALVQRLLLAVSLVGLMHYLLYLLTGKSRVAPLAALYGLFFAYQVYTIMRGVPEGVTVSRWRTDLAYGSPSPPVFALITFLWLVVPPVVGALGLLRLRRSVDERSRRLRILTVSLGLTVWWVLAVVAGNPATFDMDALQVLNRVVGLGVALAILLSYQPTPWLQRRLRLEPYPTTTTALR